MWQYIKSFLLLDCKYQSDSCACEVCHSTNIKYNDMFSWKMQHSTSFTCENGHTFICEYFGDGKHLRENMSYRNGRNPH